MTLSLAKASEVRPRLLDLFCGAGGAAMGYHRAGFEVVGVDIKPQPHYPFEFHQADAMTYPLEGFDVIHASPPCQRYSRLSLVRGKGKREEHPDLIMRTRNLLEDSGKPFVIENVKGAPLDSPITLCGHTFGLKVYRHRCFESNILLVSPPHLRHPETCPSAGKGKSKSGFVSVCGHQGGGVTMDEWRIAMGIDWMTQGEISQSIPPAYTEFIGRQLMEYLRCR